MTIPHYLISGKQANQRVSLLRNVGFQNSGIKVSGDENIHSKLEFVSAYQLVRNYKIPNEMSSYEAMIHQAVKMGMDEKVVREQLEYTILIDFILTNTDRHFNNFGFLYDSRERKLVAMAPIFDTGNALFYNNDIIPTKDNLLNIRVTSFCQKEVDLLRYVENKKLIDLDMLDGFSVEVCELLEKYTNMPSDRAEKIAQTIVQKVECKFRLI
ncbi:HipA domain-containing protein [Bariatricus sp. HCP28S3_C11]|uniref:HipA domain-containing protein n=1 Tax=unclassified Bariatricus TaxID=2677046 RepID=UPI003F89C9E0